MISICAIVRDEHRDIREWATHHLRLGFSSICLYDNNSARGYEQELGDLPNIEIRPWETNEDQRQRRAYEHFMASQQWDDDDWCAFIDADELVHLEQHKDIQSFIATYPDAAGVVLSWQCYGANGHVHRPDLPLRQSFTTPTPLIRDRHNFKTIARINEISFWADVHRIVPKQRPLVAVDHSPVLNSEPAQRLTVAWLDHYITKSWDEYVQRLRRGNITRGIRRVGHFFAYNPDMRRLAEHLVNALDEREFPTLYNDNQQRLIERLDHCWQIAARLDGIAEDVVPHRVFMQAAACELIELSGWHLTRLDAAQAERAVPAMHDLIHKQLAFLSAVPRDSEDYYGVIINNLISTPFEQVVREAG